LTIPVKSPISFIVNESFPESAALEEKENGCSFMAKGEFQTVSHANCPGSNPNPSWPSGRTVSVQESPRSSLIPSTSYGRLSIIQGFTTRT
jgi:hypothetical protein